METSATDTPARAATSASVGRFPSGVPGVRGTVCLPARYSVSLLQPSIVDESGAGNTLVGITATFQSSGSTKA
ncbi:hypothetical protein GCM10010344_34400 [Streptomyces bluensis]|nr:hypothetical protein GCM10010344_34400 [Streptomyces bluensis]